MSTVMMKMMISRDMIRVIDETAARRGGRGYDDANIVAAGYSD
jgi:hypothetical protein